jgi:hypothetical protein
MGFVNAAYSAPKVDICHVNSSQIRSVDFSHWARLTGS